MLASLSYDGPVTAATADADADADDNNYNNNDNESLFCIRQSCG